MEMTNEMIAKAYSACIDSVNLINGGKPSGVSESDWVDIVKRNKEHLSLMLSKGFWTTEDLQPIRAVVGVAE